ncbi:MAG TPA: hypothetical protein VL651_12015 [Bacteroidia bacterium]|jgi:hypothetical protein|nr:hypothetical protein [Bacteroidia bacterium]
MNNSSNTERAFHAMREMPVDISIDSIQKIVLASAAASVTVSKASIIAKLIHTKFHLNTIIAMTSFFSATAIGCLLLFSGWHHKNPEKIAANNSALTKIPELNTNSLNAGRPDISLSVDTPKQNKNVVVVANVNSDQPKDSVVIVTIENDGHGGRITRTIRSDSSENIVINNSGDSLLPHRVERAYTYVYNDGHAHGKHGNCVMITQSNVINTDSVANAGAQAYSFAYNDNILPKGKGKCIVINEMNDGNPDSLSVPSLDGQDMNVVINMNDVPKMNRRMQIVTNSNNLPGVEMNEQFIFDDNDAIQLATCNISGIHEDSLRQLLSAKLFVDKLITDQEHFTFIIDGKNLKVNGVKQSEDVYNTYKNYIESVSPNKVDRKFLYDLTVDGDQLRINVKNYTR